MTPARPARGTQDGAERVRASGDGREASARLPGRLAAILKQMDAHEANRAPFFSRRMSMWELEGQCYICQTQRNKSRRRLALILIFIIWVVHWHETAVGAIFDAQKFLTETHHAILQVPVREADGAHDVSPEEPVICLPYNSLRCPNINQYQTPFDRVAQTKHRTGAGWLNCDAADFYSGAVLGEILLSLEPVQVLRKLSLPPGQKELLFFESNSSLREVAGQSHFCGLFMGGLGQLIGSCRECFGGGIQKEGSIGNGAGYNQAANGGQGVDCLSVIASPCAHCEEEGRTIVFGGLGYVALVCGLAWVGYRHGRRRDNAEKRDRQ